MFMTQNLVLPNSALTNKKRLCAKIGIVRRYLRIMQEATLPKSADLSDNVVKNNATVQYVIITSIVACIIILKYRHDEC